MKDQEWNPRPHTQRPAALPVKVEQLAESRPNPKESLQASQLTAMGLWIALACGIFLAVLLWTSAPFVVSRVLGADPEVTVHGVTYLRCRSVAFPALLGMFVTTGSFRGHKDTQYPPPTPALPSHFAVPGAAGHFCGQLGGAQRHYVPPLPLLPPPSSPPPPSLAMVL